MHTLYKQQGKESISWYIDILKFWDLYNQQTYVRAQHFKEIFCHIQKYYDTTFKCISIPIILSIFGII